MTEDLNTKIHKIAVDEAYQQAALSRIRKIVSGNKIDPELVTLENFEGEVLQFQAEILVDVLMSVIKKTQFGKAQGSYITDGENGTRDMIAREYAGLRQDVGMMNKIREIITSMPAYGFAKGDLKIPVKGWQKSFIYYQPCPDCKSSGRSRCNKCNGGGSLDCSRCYGSGLCSCTYCNGATTIQDPNRGRIPCPTCSGRGKISCPGCRQTGKVTCSACAGRGNINCSTCNGTAWMSHIQEMRLDAVTKFSYPREKLPEKIVNLIEKRKEKIAEFSNIHVVSLQAMPVFEQEAHAAQEKIFQVPILYNVLLPYSNLTYIINGKTYYAFLFGTKGIVDHASNFLDDLLVEPHRKLVDATQNRGDILENLKRVAEYRTTREVLLLSSQYSQGKALKELRKTNSLGLSADNAKSLISMADIALKKLTLKSRIIGSVLGQLITIGILGGYFFLPVRKNLLMYIPNTIPSFTIDIVIAVLGTYIGAIMIQAIAGAALKQTLSKIMPKNVKISSSVKLGNAALIHYGIALISLFGVLETGRQFQLSVPTWYIELLGRILTLLH